MQWNFILKQCFFCAIIIHPIIRLQNKSQENLLISDVPHMEYLVKFKNTMFQLEDNEWVNGKKEITFEDII